MGAQSAVVVFQPAAKQKANNNQTRKLKRDNNSEDTLNAYLARCPFLEIVLTTWDTVTHDFENHKKEAEHPGSG